MFPHFSVLGFSGILGRKSSAPTLVLAKQLLAVLLSSSVLIEGSASSKSCKALFFRGLLPRHCSGEWAYQWSCLDSSSPRQRACSSFSAAFLPSSSSPLWCQSASHAYLFLALVLSTFLIIRCGSSLLLLKTPVSFVNFILLQHAFFYTTFHWLFILKFLRSLHFLLYFAHSQPLLENLTSPFNGPFRFLEELLIIPAFLLAARHAFAERLQ